MAVDFSDLVPAGKTAAAPTTRGLSFDDLVPKKKEALSTRIARATEKPAKVANTFMTWFTGLPQAGVRLAATRYVQPFMRDKERFKREQADFVRQPLKTDAQGYPAGKTLADEATQLAADVAVSSPTKFNKAAGTLISATAPIAENLGDPLNVLLGLGSQLGRTGPKITDKLAGTLFSPDAPKKVKGGESVLSPQVLKSFREQAAMQVDHYAPGLGDKVRYVSSKGATTIPEMETRILSALPDAPKFSAGSTRLALAAKNSPTYQAFLAKAGDEITITPEAIKYMDDTFGGMENFYRAARNAEGLTDARNSVRTWAEGTMRMIYQRGVELPAEAGVRATPTNLSPATTSVTPPLQDLSRAPKRPVAELPTPSQAKRTFKQANRAYERELATAPDDRQLTLTPELKPNAPVAPEAPDFLNRLKANEKPIVLGPEGSAPFPVEEIRNAPVREKAPLALQLDTMDRNIEGTFGEAASPVKNFLSEPLKVAVTEKTIDADSLRTVVGDKARQLDIKPGSKDDLLVGDYVEGNVTAEEVREAAPKKADAILEAAEFGRQVYRDLLGRINNTLTSYGYAPIPERQKYVTHTKQISTFIDQIGSLILGKPDTLPTAISGINIETKPGRQFFGFGKQRQGGSTHEGLFKAIDAYIDPAMSQVHLTPVIQRYRAFQRFLQREFPLEAGSKRLSSFNSWFAEFTNKISGKKDIVDRPIEKKFGRRWLGVFDGLRRKTGANLVGGSVSAALTNFIPLTQSLATTAKPAALRGLGEALLSPFKDVRMIDSVRSAFLTRRFPKSSIAPSFTTKAKNGAQFLFKIVDQFTSHAVVAGKYWEGKMKGLDPKAAMKAADGYAARVMADRSLGQYPLIFDSKVLGGLTQFQVEVNNQISFLGKDIPRNLGLSKKQIASSIVQVGIYSYLFNQLYEQLTGRRPAIDPLHWVQRAVEQWHNGDPVTDMINPIGENAVSELANALPFSSILTGGRIPVGSVLPNPLAILQGDSTVQREIAKPLFGLLPPTGGSQVRKAIKGVQAYNRGYSETESGNYRFAIEQNLPNFLRSLFFGEYSTPEAREYFKERD